MGRNRFSRRSFLQAAAATAAASAGESRLLPEIRWTKQGRILSSEGAPRWRSEQCGMTSALPWEHGGFRIFLTGRQAGSGYQIGWLDLSSELKVLSENPANPVLGSGEPGMFDMAGVCMPTVVRVSDSVLYMYYVGWGSASQGMFVNNAGLAISRDNGNTWARRSQAPLLPLDDLDPIGTGTVFVMREQPDFWRLWYTSLLRWERREPQGYLVRYHIKYAESEDGIRWRKPKDNLALPLLPNEQVNARPMVLKENGVYRMWFCRRDIGSTYRIGYAESRDGRKWTRLPSGIEPSPAGWDSEMVEYAWVLRRKADYLMLYNGNGFGRSGTGVATGTIRSGPA